MSTGTAHVFRRRTSFLLATLGRRTESGWSGLLRARGLTNAEFSALAVLVDESPGQGELAAYLGIDPRNAGALVRKLSDRRWVESVVNPDDARRRVLTLTDDGRAAWTALQSDLSTARGDYFSPLTHAEHHELERLLNKLNDAHLTGQSRAPE